MNISSLSSPPPTWTMARGPRVVADTTDGAMGFQVVFLFFVIIILLFNKMDNFQLQRNSFTTNMDKRRHNGLHPIGICHLCRLRSLHIFFLSFLHFGIFRLLLLFGSFYPHFLGVPFSAIGFHIHRDRLLLSGLFFP